MDMEVTKSIYGYLGDKYIRLFRRHTRIFLHHEKYAWRGSHLH